MARFSQRTIFGNLCLGTFYISTLVGCIAPISPSTRDQDSNTDYPAFVQSYQQTEKEHELDGVRSVSDMRYTAEILVRLDSRIKSDFQKPNGFLSSLARYRTQSQNESLDSFSGLPQNVSPVNYSAEQKKFLELVDVLRGKINSDLLCFSDRKAISVYLAYQETGLTGQPVAGKGRDSPILLKKNISYSQLNLLVRTFGVDLYDFVSRVQTKWTPLFQPGQNTSTLYRVLIDKSLPIDGHKIDALIPAMNALSVSSLDGHTEDVSRETLEGLLSQTGLHGRRISRLNLILVITDETGRVIAPEDR